MAAGALAQGLVEIDNTLANGYLTVNGGGAANGYVGAFGIEVWAAPAGTSTTAVNLTPAAGYAVQAYAALSSGGFTKLATLSGTIPGSNAGGIAGLSGDIVTLPSAIVTPAGSSAVLGLAAWNSSAASMSAALNAATSTTRAGVEAFTQSTTAPSVPQGPVVGLTGMNNDLVMMTVPEPSSFALAGLGAAALLIFRRRK